MCSIHIQGNTSSNDSSVLVITSCRRTPTGNNRRLRPFALLGKAEAEEVVDPDIRPTSFVLVALVFFPPNNPFFLAGLLVAVMVVIVVAVVIVEVVAVEFVTAETDSLLSCRCCCCGGREDKDRQEPGPPPPATADPCRGSVDRMLEPVKGRLSPLTNELGEDLSDIFL